MGKNIFALLILFAFSAGFIGELSDIFNSHTETTLSEFVCDDTDSDDCESHKEHCLYHCFGLHKIVPALQSVSLNQDIIVTGQTSWYFYIHYEEPFIAMALKPPLFS